jgi:hypothetical protein
MSDFSPWPKKHFKFEFRPSYHVRVGYKVDHDKNPDTDKEVHWQFWALKKTFKSTWGKWPFLSVLLGRFGFYIGFKPISLQDPNFVVPDSFPRDAAVCEFSMRWTAHGGR